ncbi:uncharacterized protein MELLADRAFT_56637 [Melampsora larici-populina 98AG31]|uniref:Uncharacterized protein n=1 Tax=Melampsora larici-populina (strain 98AG31 / pathotype 3-4-7) TaxID=747676 RepID=F4RSP1_MELLP|nr:uncharacterized protein MELLADRAFT_56637 [Melampsora larici-populina 98AG31]EGG04633.1 hypothetical protein MELLADRAFT_56637 [Melampsora larici-populina 98AG31]
MIFWNWSANAHAEILDAVPLDEDEEAELFLNLWDGDDIRVDPDEEDEEIEIDGGDKFDEAIDLEGGELRGVEVQPEGVGVDAQ